eukprot:4732900-Pyramimonas_sp.AAC.1
MVASHQHPVADGLNRVLTCRVANASPRRGLVGNVLILVLAPDLVVAFQIFPGHGSCCPCFYRG